MNKYLSWFALSAALCLFLAACSHAPVKTPAPTGDVNAEAQAAKLYHKAHDELVRGSYAEASKEFDTLTSRFPFSRYATQAQLEQIYAKFQSNDPEEALTDANRFMQQHPRYPNIDYVLYLKGLINMQRSKSLTRYLHINQTDHDPAYLKAAFDNLALLERRYPHSRYAADARQRMVWLRNQIALHDLNTARFYMGHGAWVAAARRAEGIIANYPGAPATANALLIMKTAYAKLGLKNQEQQVEALIAANKPSLAAAGVATKTDE